jgi:putative inorganic carbon (hco3(-)) transporter
MIERRPIPSLHGVDQRLLTLAMALAVVLVGSVYGYVLTRDLPAVLLLAIPLGAAAVILGFRQPELLAVGLLGVTWGYVSEVLVKFHDVPSVAKSLVVVMVALVLYRRFLGQRIHLTTHPLLWWMLGYLLVVAGGLWYAQYPNRTWLVVIDFVKEVLLCFVVLNTITTARWLERAVWAMLLVGAALGTLTLIQELTRNYSNDFGGFARSTVAAIADGVSNRARAGGPTSEPNAFGQQMLVLVPIGVWAALYARTVPARMLGGYAAFACLAGAALSFSRGTYLALLVMGVLLMLHLRLDLRYMLLIPLVVFALGTATPELRARLDTLVSLLPGGERITGERDASLKRREIQMLMAVYMFADHPVLGVGADNYVPLFPEYVRMYGSDVDDGQRNAHSYYLEIAAEHGLVGLITVGGIMVLAVHSLRQARRRFDSLGDRRMAELTSALLIAFIGYAVSAAFLHGDYTRFLWLQVDLAAVAAVVAWRAVQQVGAVEAAEQQGAALLVQQEPGG